MSSPRHYLPILLLQLSVLSGEPAAEAAKVPALFVFGDSTVDTGNNNFISTVVRSDFAPYGRDLHIGKSDGSHPTPTGRFSNGRLAVDFISEAFGLPPLVPPYLDPNADISDLAASACFASAGAGYDNATSDLFSVLTIWEELEYFKQYAARLRGFQGEEKAEETLAEALYLVSMGPWAPTTSWRTTTPCRRIRAVPDGSRVRPGLPAGRGGVVSARAARARGAEGRPQWAQEYNDVAEGFNAGVQAMVARLNGELGGSARIAYGDVYGPVVDVLGDPGKFGLENVEAGCCGATGRFEMGFMCNARSPMTCADAGKFAFWDAIHPTERLHRTLADAKMNATLHVFL